MLIDLSKAFDRVDHKILLNKIHHLGIRGTPNNLINSYLSNRAFYVQVNDKISTQGKSINIGLPQGGCLSPTLFNLYTHDLPHYITAKCIQYADDTLIVLNGISVEDLQHKVDKTFSEIHKYTSDNKMTLNQSKTEIIFFGRHPPISFSIGNTSVQTSNTVKYLGYTLDEKLCFANHITSTIKQINKNIPAAYIIRDFLPTYAKTIFYNAFVNSYINYCLPFIQKSTITDINRLISCQRKFIRILFGPLPLLCSISSLMYNNNIKPISDMLKKHLIDFAIKILKKQSNRIICSYFIPSLSRRTLNFNIANCLFSHSSLTLGVILSWNDLNLNLKKKHLNM